MFEFLRKEDYFRWGESGIPLNEQKGLKGAEDAFILSLLRDKLGLKILEMGGGNSRILRLLCDDNECWNIDSFEGKNNGPVREIKIENVRNVVGQLGDFSPELSDDYFDYVVSVSVMEHVPGDMLPKVFEDCRRVLKPGGFVAHAIDVYLLDKDDCDHPHQASVRSRLKTYLESAKSAGLELVEDPAPIEDPYFRGSYVSQADSVMHLWNSLAPKLRPLREIAQVVSLKAVWRKPD